MHLPDWSTPDLRVYISTLCSGITIGRGIRPGNIAVDRQRWLTTTTVRRPMLLAAMAPPPASTGAPSLGSLFVDGPAGIDEELQRSWTLR